MRNRAKCKLCQAIIESFHQHDYVSCKCGEIAVDGGNYYHKCSAKNWENFLRVDDMDNEIVIHVKDTEEPPKPIEEPKPLNRKELIDMLDAMVKNIENLPQHVMDLPVSHYDLYSHILLISQILKFDDKK